MAKKTEADCRERLRAARDALSMIQGKWKIPILIALGFGNKRFGELNKEIEGISPKMLSKELKDLEENKLIARTVYDDVETLVEYSITPLGKSLDGLLEELHDWGEMFREKILGVKPA